MKSKKERITDAGSEYTKTKNSAYLEYEKIIDSAFEEYRKIKESIETEDNK